MPRVAQYQPEVANDGGMSGRQDVAAPSGAFGADPSAVASVGQAVSQTGQQLQQWEEQQDEARAKQISTTYTPLIRTTMYGAPDGSTPGFLGQQGVNALNGRQDAVDGLEKGYDDALAQAQNPRQRAMLSVSLGAQKAAALQQIAEHTQAQGKVYFQAASQAVASEHANNYVAMLDANPAEAAAQLTAGETEIARSNAYAGLGPEAEQQAIQAYRTKAYGQYLDNALADHAGGALKAQQFFNVNQGFMDPATRAQYAEKIRTAALQYGSASFAETLANSGAGVAPGTPNMPGASVIDAVRAAGGGNAAKTNYLLTTGALESGLSANPKPNGSSQGTFQFHPSTFNALLPGGDIHNPADQAKAAGILYDRNNAALTSTLGRAPTTMELYLAHQQGLGGAKALLTADPGENAVDALMNAGVYSDRRVATQAIAGNAGSPTVTVGQFLATWNQRVLAKGRAVAATQGGNVNATTGSVVGIPDEATTVALARQAASHSFAGDPEAALAFENAARGQVGNLSAARSQRETEADRQIDLMFASKTPPTSVDQIPPGLLASASPGKQQSTYSALSGQGQYAKVDDPATIAMIHDQMVNNPTGFASANLLQYIGKLTQGSFTSLLSTQDEARRGTGAFADKQLTVKQVMDGSSEALRAAGLDPKKDAAKIAQLQTQMLGWANTYQQQNGKPPQAADIIKQRDALLLQGTAAGPGLPTQKLHVFELTGQNFQYDIPQPVLRTLQAAYTRRGGKGPIPRAMAVQYYRQGVSQGVFQ